LLCAIAFVFCLSSELAETALGFDVVVEDVDLNVLGLVDERVDVKVVEVFVKVVVGFDGVIVCFGVACLETDELPDELLKLLPLLERELLELDFGKTLVMLIPIIKKTPNTK
jgi:hypothetical protein